MEPVDPRSLQFIHKIFYNCICQWEVFIQNGGRNFFSRQNFTFYGQNNVFYDSVRLDVQASHNESLIEITKYLILKIIRMTELGFELQNIEMKVGHAIPYTFRIRFISRDLSENIFPQI
jgi:hypothetical protein